MLGKEVTKHEILSMVLFTKLLTVTIPNGILTPILSMVLFTKLLTVVFQPAYCIRF